MNIKRFYEDTNSSYQGALSIMMNDFLIIHKRRVKMMSHNNEDQSVSQLEKKYIKIKLTRNKHPHR